MVKTVAQLLAEAPVAWRRAVELLAEVCLAVDDARADGIGVALEPDAIYLDERPGALPEAKLEDDGVRGPADVDDGGADGDGAVQLWKSMVARHAPSARWQPYASPEQLRHDPLDDRSDVYTLGVLGHELLTARRPFADARSAVELRQAQCDHTPDAASAVRPDLGLPEELDEVLLRCLATAPADRFASVRVLAREFANVPQRQALREGTSLRGLMDRAGDLRARLQLLERLCRAVAAGDTLAFVAAVLTPETLVLAGDRCLVATPLALRPRNVGEEHRWQARTDDRLGYASPELLMGKARDARSVVYTLGVIAYELVTGRLPFPDAHGPAGLITAQLKQTPPPPSTLAEVPPGLDQLVLRCVEKKPEARYLDVAALADAVSELLRSELAGGG